MSKRPLLQKPRLSLLLAVSLSSFAFAEDDLIPIAIETIERAEPVDFAKEIYPILKANCLACHSETKAKVKLNLESPQSILKGSENGPVIKPGNGKDSFLLQVSAHQEDPAMPPEKNKANAKNLTPKELGLLLKWIDEGAKGEGPTAVKRPVAWQNPHPGVQPIYAVAVTPDGRYAVCGRARSISIYSLVTGAEVRRIESAHADLVQSLAISKDGMIASGGYETFKLWRPAIQPVTAEVALPDVPTALAVSPDGKWAAAGDNGGTIHRWNLEGEVKMLSDKAHNAKVTALAFAPDGQSIISGSDDKIVSWRKLEDGTEIKKWDTGQPVKALTLLDDKRVAVLLGDAVIRVYATDNETVAEWKAHEKPVRAISGVFKDQLVSVDETGLTHLWNIQEGKSVGTFNVGQPLHAFAASPNGEWLGLSTGEHLGKVWKVADKKALHDLKDDGGAKQRLDRLKQSEAIAKRLLDHRTKQKTDTEKTWKDVEKKFQTATKDEITKQGELAPKVDAFETAKRKRDRLKETVAFRESAKDELKKAEEAYTKSKKELEEADAAYQRAIFTREAQVRDTRRAHEKHLEAATLHALREGEHQALVAKREVREKEPPPTTTVHQTAFSRDGSILISLDDKNNLHTWDPKSGGLLHGWRESEKFTQLVAVPGGTFLGASADKRVMHLDPNPRWELAHTVTQLQGRVSALAFHPSGRMLATGSGQPSRNGKLQLWDTLSGTLLREASDPHKDIVTGIDFTHDGNKIATASPDKFVKTWRTSNLDLIRAFEGHTSYAQDVAWKADGLFLASAGADQVIKVWDFEAQKVKETVKGFKKEVTSVRYVGLDDTILSGSGDPQVKLGTQVLSGVSDFVYAVDSDPAGSVIVAGGLDGILRVWNAKDRKLLYSFEPPKTETAAK